MVIDNFRLEILSSDTAIYISLSKAPILITISMACPQSEWKQLSGLKMKIRPD